MGKKRQRCIRHDENTSSIKVVQSAPASASCCRGDDERNDVRGSRDDHANSTLPHDKVNGRDGSTIQEVHRRVNERIKSEYGSSSPWLDWYEFYSVGQNLLSALDLKSPFSKKKEHHLHHRPTVQECDLMEEKVVNLQEHQQQHLQQNHEVDADDLTLLSSIEEALERVKVWRTRCQLLPHSVDSTACLAQVLLREAQQQVAAASPTNSTVPSVCTCPRKDTSSSKICSRCSFRSPSSCTTSDDQELRMSYSCAIIRSVNGLAENGLHDRRNKRSAVGAGNCSIAVLCRELGLPSWLVDIRHAATHDQLPSLPVLRLGAVTILQYLRSEYWDALSGARRKHWEKAMEILRSYETACEQAAVAEKEKATEAASSPPTRKRRKRNRSCNDAGRGESSDDGSGSSSTDDDDEEDILIINDPWGSRILGKTFNRFAVLRDLMSSSKKSKKKQKNASQEKPEPDEKQSTTSRKRTPKPFSPLGCAKKLVHADDIPVDVAYQACLSFLVWGEQQQEGHSSSCQDDRGNPATDDVRVPGVVGEGSQLSSVACGALIPPPSSTSFPETTSAAAAKLRKRYLPLLRTLGRTWPGFLHALLVHLVDAVLAIEKRGCQEKEGEGGAGGLCSVSRRKLYFLDAWVRYVVSRAFVSELDPSVIMDQCGTAVTAAPFHVLQDVLQYPIKSLHRRCCSARGCCSDDGRASPTADLDEGNGRGQRATSRGFSKLFADILDEHQHRLGSGAIRGDDDNVTSGRNSADPIQIVGPSPLQTQASALSGPLPLGGHEVDQKKQTSPADRASSSPPPTDDRSKQKNLTLDEIEAMLTDDCAPKDACAEDTNGVCFAGASEGDNPVRCVTVDGVAETAEAGSNRSTLLSPVETPACAGPPTTEQEEKQTNEDTVINSSASLTNGNSKNSIPAGTSNERAIGGKEPSTLENRPLPWTRCQFWEPCAIGTMPGYPS